MQLATAHWVPLQVMVPFGSWCAASVQFTPPQLVTELETQLPPLAWKPALQLSRTQLEGAVVVEMTQWPVPLGNAVVVQSLVGDPQAVLVSSAQAAPLTW